MEAGRCFVLLPSLSGLLRTRKLFKHRCRCVVESEYQRIGAAEAAYIDATRQNALS
jgi:hypothetical protein